jgi:N utilization substance protein B
MSETPAKPVNPSLQKKTAARTAAVQCIYTLSITGEKTTPAQQIAQLKNRLENNRDEQKLTVGVPLEPNYKLVETLLEGVAGRLADIDALVDGVLNAEWKRERMSPLLIAILQCSIYELCLGKEISAKIVIDEYTRLTRSFFADPEVNFVHGALSTLAQKHHG